MTASPSRRARPFFWLKIVGLNLGLLLALGVMLELGLRLFDPQILRRDPEGLYVPLEIYRYVEAILIR